MNLEKYNYSPMQFKGRFKHPNNGTITVTNKAGDECELEYENGKIKKSSINSVPYKEYYYYDYMPIYASKDLKQRHTFADGTQLDNDQFWHDEGIQYERILQPRNNYQSCEIIRPNSSKYKNEPVLTIKQENKPAKVYIRTNGKEKIEFKTIKEAEDYFMQEYGIDAKFADLKQAFLMKEAVEDFLKLDDKYAQRAKMLLRFLDIKIGSNEHLDDEEKEAGTCAYCKGATIYLNSDYDWNDVENDFLQSYKKEFHPHHSAKSCLIHELGHFFHYMDSPAFFNKCCDDFKNDDEKMLAKQVSTYAMKNPHEFVAEYTTGRIAGHAYSEEIDKMYKSYHDPDRYNR